MKEVCLEPEATARLERAGSLDLPWLAERKWLRIMEPRARAGLQVAWEVLGGSAAPEGAGLVVVVPDVSWSAVGGVEVWAEAPPLWLLGVLPNSLAGHISRTFAITGPVLTCAKREEALETAAAWLAEGAATGVLLVEVSSGNEAAWARGDWFGRAGEWNR